MCSLEGGYSVLITLYFSLGYQLGRLDGCDVFRSGCPFILELALLRSAHCGKLITLMTRYMHLNSVSYGYTLHRYYNTLNMYSYVYYIVVAAHDKATNGKMANSLNGKYGG